MARISATPSALALGVSPGQGCGACDRDGLQGDIVPWHPITNFGFSRILRRFNGAVRIAKSRQHLRQKAQMVASNPESHPDAYQNGAGYHPLEDLSISELEERDEKQHGRLTNAEIARTIAEMNSTAILLASSISLENSVFGTEVQYLVDKDGGFYFKLADDNEALQNLLATPTCSVLVGFGDLDELLASDLLVTYGESIVGNQDGEDEEGDDDEDEEDDDEDEDENEDEDGIFDEGELYIEGGLEDDLDGEPSSLAENWGGLDTLSDVHPVDFASKMAEVVMRDITKTMFKPSKRIIITGAVELVSADDNPKVQRVWKERYDMGRNSDADIKVTKPVEDVDQGSSADEADNVKMASSLDAPQDVDHKLGADSGKLSDGLDDEENEETKTSFYKFVMHGIELTSNSGHQTTVDIKDFENSEPDVLAHSASDIIDGMNADAKKIKKALKALCYRDKGLKVEEAAIVGLDSLGVDVRITCGTEVRTLRFSFSKRAKSPDTAQVLLHLLLYPHQKYKTS